MKIEHPFFIPFFSFNCDFFDDIKDEIIDTIMTIHNKDPFTLRANFPLGKYLKKNISESKENFFSIESDCIKRLREWTGMNVVKSYNSLNIVIRTRKSCI